MLIRTLLLKWSVYSFHAQKFLYSELQQINNNLSMPMQEKRMVKEKDLMFDLPIR